MCDVQEVPHGHAPVDEYLQVSLAPQSIFLLNISTFKFSSNSLVPFFRKGRKARNTRKFTVHIEEKTNKDLEQSAV